MACVDRVYLYLAAVLLWEVQKGPFHCLSTRAMFVMGILDT